MRGGPINIPAMPYVERIDIAIPAEYFFDPVDSTNVIGITEAVPAPTRQKPASEVQKEGNSVAIRIPEKMREALMMKALGIPIYSMI